MVGCGYDVDATVGGIIEHTEKLVYLAVVMLVSLIARTFRHHCVKLVEEQQCGCFLLRILEYFAYLLLCSMYPCTGEVIRHDLHEVDAYLLGHLLGKCDRVLVDAPCTGTGTWRRNPELRWRLTPQGFLVSNAVIVRVLEALSL